MLRIPACLILGLILVATPASAGIPDPNTSQVELYPDTVLATCPASSHPLAVKGAIQSPACTMAAAPRLRTRATAWETRSRLS